MPRFAAIEMPQVFGDVAGALDRADAILGTLDGVDLAVFPEAILTGYVSPSGDSDLRAFAEPEDGPTAKRLADLARSHGIALAGPIVEVADGRFYNAFLVFDASGRRVAHYRKRHPWYLETWADPGDLGTPRFEIAGVTIAIAICFDVHFVSDDAGATLDGADVLLFPSAWVDDGPEDARSDLLPSLARRHRVAIVNANWGPSSPRIRGQGGSRIVSASGDVVARVERGSPAIAVLE